MKTPTPPASMAAKLTPSTPGAPSFFLPRLNQEALEWRDKVALQRPWPGDDRRTVAQAFAEEKPLLLPLPEHPLDTDQVVPVRSHKSIYIRFDKNDDTIPHTAVGEPLALVASHATVRILQGKDEITRHRRSYDRHQRIEDPAHIEALLAEKQGARASVHRARLPGAVPEAEEFLEAAFRKAPLFR
jgi:hypothetical protein